MTLTLLIDLDDTLLGNDMGTFIPAYLNLLSQHLSSYVDPKQMVPTMLDATQEMFQNLDPDCTLKDVFDAAFYLPLGLDEAALKHEIEGFYADIFPKLRTLTQYRPEAVELIENALSLGYQIGIATNPLFPLTAIRQRLNWAGLPSDDFPFLLIPSYETFHFAKPNPAFFAEFLGWIGWPQDPVVMIGNDRNHDIRGARLLGLPAFWISEREIDPEEGNSIPTASGNLDQVIPWLQSFSQEELKPTFDKPSAFKAILRGTPAALSGLTNGISVSGWSRRNRVGEWSIKEVCCHLRDVELEVNLHRLDKVINEDNPFLAGEDTDRWAEERQYIQQDGILARQEFTIARKKTLRLLEELEEFEWQRPARHAIFGPTNIRELVSIIAGHDRLHLRQVHQLISDLDLNYDD
ncbi:MAG: DinB family protein [Anaerolineales bacterium]